MRGLLRKKSVNRFPKLKKVLPFLLALIGSGTVIYSAGAVALHLARNHAPDSLVELASPNHRYRIVITEELAGFPSSNCIKQVYVLPIDASFDRNDEDNEVYVGACEGLTDVQWNGNRVQGKVALAHAIEGVKALRLKAFAAKGEVRLFWSAR